MILLVLLLFAPRFVGADPYLEASFDLESREGLLVLRESGTEDLVLHRIPGHHVEAFLPAQHEGRPAVRVLWTSHPRGGEVLSELWVRARPDQLVRAEPAEDEPVRIAIPLATRFELPEEILEEAGPLDPGEPPAAAVVTPAEAHELLDRLGFYRPVVMISLKRRYKAYVKKRPRPPGIPVSEFPRYQMALLALAQGSGGPNQASHRINRRKYFDKGKAYDLDARVIDWYSKPKQGLRTVLSEEGRRLAAALVRYPGLPEIGRLATPMRFGVFTRDGALALETERVGLDWHVGEKAVLLDSVMQQETHRIHWKLDRRPTASAAGAIGFGQLMPFNRMYHPDANEYDPAENVVETAGDLNRWLQEAKHPRTAASRRASRYFSSAPDGRLRFALAMYNGGYATTVFARTVYSPSIMKMVSQGGPNPPVVLPDPPDS